MAEHIVTPKAAQLMNLAAAGIPVPPFTVLSQDEMGRAKGFLADDSGVEPLFAWLSHRIGDLGSRLAIRPSYPDEDRLEHTNAGNYTSYIGIPNEATAFHTALTGVITEWDSIARLNPRLAPELIVQHYIDRRVHGVALTADPDTGSLDYVVVSTTIGSEDVTAGAAETKTVYATLDQHSAIDIAFGESHLSDAELTMLLSTLREIEPLIAADIRDVEFGFADSALHIFQARPTMPPLSPPAITEFQGGRIQDIAPAYKEIFSRHRRKRHRLYEAIDGTGLLFPRSLVLDLLQGQEVVEGALDRLAADSFYVPAAGLSRPRRKEDFVTIRREELNRYSQTFGRQHLLVTEAPSARKSGYLHVTDNAYGECVEGGFDAFEAGKSVKRLDVKSRQIGDKFDPLPALLQRLQATFPGAVAEWIEDTSGRIWLYDATLPNDTFTAGPTATPSQLSGQQLVIDAAAIEAIQKRTKYPISVYAEDDELQQALAIDIDDIFDGISRSEDFYVSAPFPSTALSVFTLFPGFTGFRLQGGSTLCHLALIARSKGLGFEIGSYTR